VAIHLLASVAGIAWSFIVTLIILFTMKSLSKLPKLKPLLDISLNSEDYTKDIILLQENGGGTDRVEIGETEYDNLISDIIGHVTSSGSKGLDLPPTASGKDPEGKGTKQNGAAMDHLVGEGMTQVIELN